MRPVRLGSRLRSAVGSGLAVRHTGKAQDDGIRSKIPGHTRLREIRCKQHSGRVPESAEPQPNPLVRKLEAFADLTAADKVVIERLTAHPRECRAGEDLIRQGDTPQHVFLLMEGWAYRYKTLSNGKRQILAYLLPGDFCDIHIFVLKSMDHSIALLNNAKVVAVPAQAMLDLMSDHPAIERALWWATLVDEAVLREWLTSIGQRDAFMRIAHLLAELWLRMRMIGLADGNEFSLPLTQAELGDGLGLTPAHVNRTLRRLRKDGLISLDRKRLTIHHPEQLMALSNFEPNYLHLDINGEPAPIWRGKRYAGTGTEPG